MANGVFRWILSGAVLGVVYALVQHHWKLVAVAGDVGFNIGALIGAAVGGMFFGAIAWAVRRRFKRQRSWETP